MSFLEVLTQADPRALRARVEAATAADVERALSSAELTYSDFLALISPAASSYLEAMAQRARSLTLQRFGRVIQLYAPIYVSNECTNRCVYCSFAATNDVPRSTLGVEQAATEAEVLRRMGFQHLLVVSGEAPRAVPVEYFEQVLRRIRTRAAYLALEIYPLETAEYARLVDAGADGVTLYQETYDPEIYRAVHPAGRKADYSWRLSGLERAGEAGMTRLNVGALLGLNEWRSEAAIVGLHASWLTKRYWRAQISVSFPRLRRGPKGYGPSHPVSDAALVQMMTAARLFLPDAGIVLSTREPSQLRDALIPLGVTQMSAGSRTEPGGYSVPCEEGAQFDVQDRRSPEQVAEVIRKAGYEPVWKDWDRVMARPVAAA
ncbi:MAG: 2-iminoacetate synthase ThiH [Deltaproteobacteria bacterium]|nr:2-iminoacetate synthase ThiH [Deltaproteobacteria bacterium]